MYFYAAACSLSPSLKNGVLSQIQAVLTSLYPASLAFASKKVAAVPRFKPDPAAVARFAFDVDHAGRFTLSVVSAHCIGDATVFAEGSDTLRQRMAAAGNGQRLVQGFVDSVEHSY